MEILLQKFGKFCEHIAKILPENSLRLPKNPNKNEIISLNYDVNEHVPPNQNLFNFIVSKNPSKIRLTYAKICITLISAKPVRSYSRWILIFSKHGYWR